MGLFSRMKQTIKSKANGAVDSMISPEKEIDLAIAELEDIHKKAMEELVAYKVAAKQMEQQLAEEEKRSAEWEKRAMAAIQAGDDELAKKALRERQSSLAEVAKIKRDRDEAASHAIQLNKSRKTADTKLRILKLKKGTMATQLLMARTGSSSPLGVDDSLFDKLTSAEERIDGEVIAAEVHAAMQSEDMDNAEFDRKLLAAGADAADIAGGGQEDSLAALKAQMAKDREKKALSAGAPGTDKPAGKPEE